MSFKYVVTRIDIAEPTPSKPLGFARAMFRLNKYAKRMGGPVVLEVDGVPGPQLSVPVAIKRVRHKLPRAPKGTRIRVHPDTGPHVAIRKLEVADPLEPANIYATDSIRLIYAWTFERFDFVFNNGLYASKPGLHGTRPPDAWDAGVRYQTDEEAHGRVMALFHTYQDQALLYQQTGGREGLPINGAIGMSSVFGPYGYTPSRRYGGEAHVTHCHVSGSPVPAGMGGWI